MNQESYALELKFFDGVGSTYWNIVGPRGVIADTMNRDANFTDEEDANHAQLFAAAPDLLEACKAIVCYPGGARHAYDLAKAAIAKAKP